MCHNIPRNTAVRQPNISNGCSSLFASCNSTIRTSDAEKLLSTSDKEVSEKIETFRGTSYYVLHEGNNSSPYVILKKVN